AGPWYGMDFLSLNRVLEQWESWKETIVGFTQNDVADLDKYCSSVPEGHVKAKYATIKWIPFAYDWGGNYLGIDLDPDAKGKVGQVINFGRDESKKFVVAPDIPSFVEWLVSELDSGNFSIRVEDDGGRSFNT